MSKDRNALKSGIFILLTIVAILGVIVGIKGLSTWSEPKELRAAFFTLKDDVGGLQTGDDVRVGGFKVGTVEKIVVVGADQEDPANARVRIEFTFPKKYVVRHEASLRIQTGVTGASCLNFESLGRGEKLPSNEEIAGRAGGLSEMLATISQLGEPMRNILGTVDRKTLPAVNEAVVKYGKTADSFTTTSEHATKLIDDVHDKIDPAIKKYDTVTDRTAEMMVKIRDLFGDTTPDFRATAAHMASITASVDKKMPSIVDRVDGLLTKLDKTVESANVALEDVKSTAINAKDLTASAKNVITGNRGKLDSMIAGLKVASDNLKNATAEIRRSPWRLLYKPAPNEMANLNLYDAAREFAEGANELNDASLALRDAVQNQQLDKEGIEKLMQRVTKSFDGFQAVEQKLWTKVRED